MDLSLPVLLYKTHTMLQHHRSVFNDNSSCIFASFNTKKGAVTLFCIQNTLILPRFL